MQFSVTPRVQTNCQYSGSDSMKSSLNGMSSKVYVTERAGTVDSSSTTVLAQLSSSLAVGCEYLELGTLLFFFSVL